MTLKNLKLLARAYIPGNKISVIGDDVLDIILGSAVLDIAAYTVCLPTNKKFNAVADQQEYLLSTVLGDYLTPDKPGLWWNTGSEWIQLNARTMTWLDINRPGWRDLDSGDPQDYCIDGDILTIVPAPDTTLSEGFRFYYGKKPPSMTANDQYPFSGSTVELTHLSIFDEPILKFAQWKINPMLSKDQMVDLTEAAYRRDREEKYLAYKRRKDVSATSDARMRG